MSAPLPPPAGGEAAAPGGAQFLLVQLTLVEDGVPRDVLAFIGSSDISAEQLEALMHTTGPTGAPPAAAAAIAAIPKVVIRVRGSARVGAAGEVCVDYDEDKVPCCVVCVEDFGDGVEVSKLACGHMYHEGCIGEWLGRHNTCPVCRVELPAEEAAPAPSAQVPVGEEEHEGGLFRAMRGILGRRRRRDEGDPEVQPPRRSRRLNSNAAGRAAAGASEAATRTGGSGSVNISSGPAAAVAAAHAATHTGSGSASTARSASANASSAPAAGSRAGAGRGNRRPVAVPMPGVPGVNFVLENSEAANGMEAVTVAAVSAALQAAAAQAGLGGIQSNVGHGRSATMAALANLFRGGRGRRGRGRGGARGGARGRGGRGRGRGQ